MRKFLTIFCAFLAGCATAPKGIKPVTGFEPERYLGLWHEVARLDHSFERGLTGVTAEYKARPDGGLDVLNRGYKASASAWKEVRGRAYFTSGRDTAQLKVSFFRPFYGGYNVVELDRENYSYALVCGPSLSYLWILARSPELPPGVLERLKARAAELGFDAGALVYPGPAPSGGR